MEDEDSSHKHRSFSPTLSLRNFIYLKYRWETWVPLSFLHTVPDTDMIPITEYDTGLRVSTPPDRLREGSLDPLTSSTSWPALTTPTRLDSDSTVLSPPSTSCQQTTHSITTCLPCLSDTVDEDWASKLLRLWQSFLSVDRPPLLTRWVVSTLWCRLYSTLSVSSVRQGTYRTDTAKESSDGI